MKRTCGIYSITCTRNNKKIIGASSNIEKRWSVYKSNLRHNKYYKKDLQEDYNTYGEDSFVYEVIEECSLENIDEREKYWIDYYKNNSDFEVYNKNTPFKRVPITNPNILHRMSEAQKGENNGNARLNESDVITIKKLIRDGYYCCDIANLYEVRESQISNIKQGLRWSHIQI